MLKTLFFNPNPDGSTAGSGSSAPNNIQVTNSLPSLPKEAGGLSTHKSDTPTQIVKPHTGAEKPPDSVLALDFDTAKVDFGPGGDVEIIDDTKDNTTSASEAKSDSQGPKVKPVEPVKPATTQPVVQTGATNKTRDVSTYSPEVQKHLKSMSNTAFEWVKGILDNQNSEKAKVTDLETRLAEKSKEIPDSWINHTEAHILSPVYKEAKQDMDYAEYEYQHTRSQLSLLKAGKPVQLIVQYDADGKPVLSQPLQPSPDIEADIMLRLGNCQTAYNAARSKAEKSRTTFATDYNNSVAVIEDGRKKFFSWNNKPEGEQEVVQVNGKPTAIKQIKADFVSLIPKNFSDHPVVKLGADLFVGIQMYAAKIKSLEEENTRLKTIATDNRVAAQPSGDRSAVTAATNDEFNMDGMP